MSMHADSLKVIRQSQILAELGQFCSRNATLAEAMAEWCYPAPGEYVRPLEGDLLAMNGVMLSSSNQDQKGRWVTSGWSESPTEEWLMPDGSRLVVAYSGASPAPISAPPILRMNSLVEGDRTLRLPKTQMADFMSGNYKRYKRAYARLQQWLRKRQGWVVVR